MRRLAPIMLSILIGALTVAIGMGVSLSKANADRERLSQLIETATTKADRAQTDGQRAIDEANKQIEEAKTRVDTALSTIRALQEERDLMTKATILPSPTPSTIKGWKEGAHVGLGLSLKYPPNSHFFISDTSLSIALTDSEVEILENRWLYAETYSARLQTELESALSATTSISFLQNGHLLVGTKGVDSSSKDVYVLRLIQNGEAKKLLWIREPIGQKKSLSPLTVLSTLQFAD